MGYLFFFASFALYLAGLAPSISVGDSGEFVASAAIIGLPHAPSYPLMNLFGKMAISLLPWGNIAYRMNVLNALFTVGSGTLLYSFLRKRGWTKIAALASGTFLVLSRNIWLNGTITEVFALNTFFALLIFYLSFRFTRWVPALLAFLFGLGLGNHHTLLLIALALLPPLFQNFQWRQWFSFRILLLLFSFFLLGFSLYLYLPIRSFKNPFLDWSNPENIRNFWRVISRADYGGMKLTLGDAPQLNFATALAQSQRFLSGLIEDISPGIFWLALLGIFFLFRRERTVSFSISILFIVTGPFFFILANLPFDAQSAGILGRFLILPVIASVISAGGMLEYLNRRFPGYPAGKLLFLLVLFPLLGRLPHLSLRSFFLAEDYGRNILRTLPQNAVLFIDGGDDTFYSLAYLQAAARKRPDLEIHDRGGLVFPSAYGNDFRWLPTEYKEKRRREVEEKILHQRGWLYYSTFSPEILPGHPQRLRGILVQVKEETTHHWPPINYFPLYSYRNVYPGHWLPEYRMRALVPLYPYQQGVYALDTGQGKTAESYFKRARQIGSDVVWLVHNLYLSWHNLAYAAFQAEELALSKNCYQEALLLKPGDGVSLVNLGTVWERLDELRKAEDCYEEALQNNPRLGNAHFNLGVIYWRQGKWESAEKAFRRALEVDPENSAARKYWESAQSKISSG